MRKAVASILAICVLVTCGMVFAGVDRDLQQVYDARYLNKTFFLKMPITSDPFRIYVRSNRYRIVNDENSRLIFKLGDQVRIIKIDFGGRDIEMNITSLDQSRSARIRFLFPTSLDARFSASDSFNQVLAKLFTQGLSYTDLDKARSDYIQDQYENFVQDESRMTDMGEKDINQAALSANPAGQDLMKDVKNLQSRITDLDAQVRSLTEQNKKMDADLAQLRQEKMILESAAKDYQGKIKALGSARDDLQKELNRQKRTLQQLETSIRGTLTELGIKVSATHTPGEWLQTLSREYLQLSAGNQAYQNRVESLESTVASQKKAIDTANTRISDLTSQADRLQKDNQEFKKQIDILVSKDKTLAREMLQLQHQKNVIESKLLSRNLLNVSIHRQRKENEQIIDATIAIKKHTLGTITITAPREVSPSQPLRITLRSRLQSREELEKITDPDLKLMLKYLKHFPDFIIRADKRSPDFELKEIQSPDRDNTDLWVWEAVPKGEVDIDVVFHFISEIESEPLPVFDLPLSISYPTVEKKLVEFFQPLPLGLGIVIGLLIALPFVLIRRRRSGGSNTPPPPDRPRSLHFDKKEL